MSKARNVLSHLVATVVAAAVTLFFSVAAARADVDSKDSKSENDLKTQLRAVGRCVEKNLLKIKRGRHDLLFVVETDKYLFEKFEKLTVYHEITIFHHIINNYEEFNSGIMDDSYCLEIYLKKYLEVLRAAQMSHDQSKKPDFAPPGQQEWDADSWVAEAFHNNFGKHDLGHSDITAAAILSKKENKKLYDILNAAYPFTPLNDDKEFKANCKCRASEAAIIFLSRASQSPDLYRWDYYEYHAHSPDFRPDDSRGTRIKKVNEGKELFLSTIEKHVREIVSLAKVENWRRAAFHLGIIAHMVQDLVYHHGISLRHHSGLAYFKGEGFHHPDYPEGIKKGMVEAGSEAAKRFAKASVFTLEVFKRILGGLPSEVAVRHVFNASVKKEKDFKTLAEAAFSWDRIKPARQDLCFESLGHYFALHWEYKSAVINDWGQWLQYRAELRAIDTWNELWNPDDVMNDVHKRIDDVFKTTAAIVASVPARPEPLKNECE